MLNSFRGRLLASTLLVGSAALASPALAQEGAGTTIAPTSPTGAAPTTTTNAESPAAGTQIPESSPNAPTSTGEIVVTGSLIKNPNLVAAAPVQVIGQDEIQLRQSNTAEEILRDLPGAVANIGDSVNNGNGGQSFVDLRGLGSFRNIVVLDGKRVVPGSLTGEVDLNDIPLALIERTESLTGGAATTYGADAVAGVVNFVTRSDFAGAEINASEQLDSRGDGEYFRVDATVGANFDDDRGNAVLSIGYQDSKPVFQGDRGFSRDALDSFSGAISGSTTAFPAVFNVPGIGNAQINTDTGALTTRAAPTTANPLAQAGVIYAPFNFNPYNLLRTPFQRYNIYGAAHYQITDHVEFYTRGLYSRNRVDTIVAPSGVFASQVTIPLSNPYLPAAARSQFCANSDFNPNVAGIQTLTPAQCAAGAAATDPNDPNYRTFSPTLRIRTTDVGNRTSEFQTDVFDYRGGLRGAINDHLNYDLNGSYGESTNRQSEGGYVGLSRVRDALLATNTSTCLSGNAGCVPVNIFGPAGSITPDQSAYLTENAFNSVETSLAQANLTINGDFGVTSPFADKPINFAVGSEYRAYRASQTADVLSQDPSELGGAGGAVTPFNGGYNVLEGFGELIAPLVAHRPFIESLELETGIRYSHYRVDAPNSPTYNTTTYKAGGTYEPVTGIKFRGVYQHSVRAPNIFELFKPNSVQLTNLNADPCAGAAPTNNANLAAVCLAQGAPAFSIGSISNPAANQPNATVGGNINLKPEKSNSYTIGTVLEPRMIRGLSISVDYYHIRISKAITNPTPLDAIAACFGDTAGSGVTAASATSAACTQIRRDPNTGSLDGDPGTTGGLFLGLTNAGTLLTDGIDLNANYKHDIGPGVLNLSYSGNWTNRSLFKATPTSINRECVGYYSPNCSFSGSLQPEFYWNFRSTYSLGKVDLSVLWRHINHFRQEPDDVANGDGAAFVGVDGDGDTVNFGRIKAQNYIDLSTRIGVNDHFDFTVTVTNALDKKPPLVGYDIGNTAFNSGNTYPSTYDTLGRRFAVSGRVKF